MSKEETIIIIIGSFIGLIGFALVYFNRKNIKELKEEAVLTPITNEDTWIRFKDEKPPHKVVLAACYTYDCGWVIYTAWWYEDKKCWMMTGNDDNPSHLEFTHWRPLPDEPVDLEEESKFD